MSRMMERINLNGILLLSMTSVLVAAVAQVLPSHVALWLAAWVLSSVPLGIGIGHCVLSEE